MDWDHFLPSALVIKVLILKEVNFRKMQLCRVEHFLNTSLTFFSSKSDSLVIKTLERIRFSSDQKIGEGESNFDDKYVEKVFNKCSTGQSCIFLKFTSFKIGTLV